MAKDNEDDMTPEERAEYELIKERAGKECICGDCLEQARKAR